MKKVIRLTESQLKEIINDKLAQASGGEPRSYPSGEQWTMEEETSLFKIDPELAFKIYDLLAYAMSPGFEEEFPSKSHFFTWLNENLWINKSKEPRSSGSGGWRN